MKKYLFILFATFLFACNQGNKPPAYDAHADHEHNEEVAQDAQQPEKLVLNNGSKWKADDATNTNVAELKKITDNFKAIQTPTTEDYQALNGNMARGLNKMIQQCKMEGPDHDALHHWLEPILKQNTELKELISATESRRIFDSLDTRINIYPNYFE
ncbi:MAG: hypothetical protein ABI123_02275 [Ginsengibacter sp.]|jgi:small-conductance mechanosensitive channel